MRCGLNTGIVLFLYIEVCLCLYVKNENKTEAFKVFRIYPQTWENVKSLDELRKLAEDDNEIDFWLDSRHPGQFADIMVAPKAQSYFVEFLLKHDLQFKITIDDVEKMIYETEHHIKNENLPKNDIPNENETNFSNFDEFLFFRRLKDEPIKNGDRPFERVRQVRANYPFGQYTDYPTMVRYMRTIEFYYPHIAKLIRIGTTHEGQPIEGLKLVSGYGKDPIITFYLNKMNFFIVPCLNPDGYEYSRSSAWPEIRLWRKNRSPEKCAPSRWGGIRCCSGVDLNRNFDFHWSETGGNKHPCSNEFVGDAPFSEPESKALKDFLTSSEMAGKLQGFITLHTYAQLWIHPFSHEVEYYPNDYTKILNVAEKAVARLRDVYGTQYRIGTGADLLYPAAGGSDDWAKEKLGVKYVYLLELRPQLEQSNGFILKQEELIPTAIESFEGIKVVIETILEDNGMPVSKLLKINRHENVQPPQRIHAVPNYMGPLNEDEIEMKFQNGRFGNMEKNRSHWSPPTDQSQAANMLEQMKNVPQVKNEQIRPEMPPVIQNMSPSTVAEVMNNPIRSEVLPNNASVYITNVNLSVPLMVRLPDSSTTWIPSSSTSIEAYNWSLNTTRTDPILISSSTSTESPTTSTSSSPSSHSKGYYYGYTSKKTESSSKSTSTTREPSTTPETSTTETTTESQTTKLQIEISTTVEATSMIESSTAETTTPETDSTTDNSTAEITTEILTPDNTMKEALDLSSTTEEAAVETSDSSSSEDASTSDETSPVAKTMLEIIEESSTASSTSAEKTKHSYEVNIAMAMTPIIVKPSMTKESTMEETSSTEPMTSPKIETTTYEPTRARLSNELLRKQILRWRSLNLVVPPRFTTKTTLKTTATDSISSQDEIVVTTLPVRVNYAPRFLTSNPLASHQNKLWPSLRIRNTSPPAVQMPPLVVSHVNSDPVQKPSENPLRYVPPTTCEDKKYSCTFWIKADKNVCYDQQRFMRLHCAFSCGFCERK